MHALCRVVHTLLRFEARALLSMALRPTLSVIEALLSLSGHGAPDDDDAQLQPLWEAMGPCMSCQAARGSSRSRAQDPSVRAGEPAAATGR